MVTSQDRNTLKREKVIELGQKLYRGTNKFYQIFGLLSFGNIFYSFNTFSLPFTSLSLSLSHTHTHIVFVIFYLPVCLYVSLFYLTSFTYVSFSFTRVSVSMFFRSSLFNFQDLLPPHFHSNFVFQYLFLMKFLSLCPFAFLKTC